MTPAKHWTSEDEDVEDLFMVFLLRWEKENGSARLGCPFHKSVAMESINSVSCLVWLAPNDLFSSIWQNIPNL